MDSWLGGSRSITALKGSPLSLQRKVETPLQGSCPCGLGGRRADLRWRRDKRPSGLALPFDNLLCPGGRFAVVCDLLSCRELLYRNEEDANRARSVCRAEPHVCDRHAADNCHGHQELKKAFIILAADLLRPYRHVTSSQYRWMKVSKGGKFLVFWSFDRTHRSISIPAGSVSPPGRDRFIG